MVGIVAGTAALIIVLSVFNGMQEWVLGNFNRFNPPFKIEAKEGKTFQISDFPFEKLENIKEISSIEPILSDLALITYHNKQTLATLKGVSKNYPKYSNLCEMVIDGEFSTDSENGVVLGASIAGLLDIELREYEHLKLFYPKRTKKNLSNPIDAFQSFSVRPIGVFATYTPYDEEFVFIPINLAKELFEYENELTSVEIFIQKNVSLNKVQNKIEKIVGDTFELRNQFQQEEVLFKTINAEKLVIFIVLSFIFMVAAFNIIGVLGMLLVEKKQDISILQILGASKTLLKKVFLWIGLMISIIGGVIGLLIGLIICLIQQHFEIVTLGSEGSYALTAYPVSVSAADFALVFLVMVAVSFITSLLAISGLKTLNIKNIH